MRAVNLLALAGLAGALATASAATAQVSGAVHLATVERTAAAARAPLDARALEARMASADRAMKRGSVARARSMYEALALELRAENRLPAEAVWRLAAIEYGLGSPLKAAAILDALAVEASPVDVTVEILALFEAAHIYALEGMSKESASRLDRGARLLGSSELPVETRVALLKKVRA